MRFVLLLGVMAIAILFAVYAFADDVVIVPPDVPTDSYLRPIWDITSPIAAVLLNMLVPLVIGVVGYLAFVARSVGHKIADRINDSLGIQDEAKRLENEKMFTEAVHRSATNAMNFAIASYKGPALDFIKGHVPDMILNDAYKYFRQLNPDALVKLSHDDVIKIILSKAPAAQNVIDAASPAPPSKDAPDSRG